LILSLLRDPIERKSHKGSKIIYIHHLEFQSRLKAFRPSYN